MMALVSYLGYSSDNDEEVSCSNLKALTRKKKKKKVLSKKGAKDSQSSQAAVSSMFSPHLAYDEQQRLKWVSVISLFGMTDRKLSRNSKCIENKSILVFPMTVV